MISENEKILTKHHRFELLDAVRGIAALFVAFFHTPPTMQKLVPFTVPYLAVDLFFCLSGFVISFSYEERLRKGMSLGQFFLARIIRLYPLYFLGMILGLFAMLGRSYFLAPDDRPGLEMLTALGFSSLMLPTLAGKFMTTNVFPFDPPGWSLFFEMFINVVYAGLLLRRLANNVVLTVIALASIVLTILYVFRYSGTFDSGDAQGLFFPAFLRVSFSFLVGVLLFRLHRRWPNLLAPRFHRLAGILVVLLLIGTLGNTSSWITRPECELLIVAVIMPILVFFGAAVRVSTRWKRPCEILGEFSYPMYILCVPLFAPLFLVQKLHIQGFFYQFLGPIAAFALIPITRWIALYYDAPVRKLLSRILTPRPSSQGAITT